MAIYTKEFIEAAKARKAANEEALKTASKKPPVKKEASASGDSNKPESKVKSLLSKAMGKKPAEKKSKK